MAEGAKRITLSFETRTQTVSSSRRNTLFISLEKIKIFKLKTLIMKYEIIGFNKSDQHSSNFPFSFQRKSRIYINNSLACKQVRKIVWFRALMHGKFAHIIHIFPHIMKPCTEGSPHCPRPQLLCFQALKDYDIYQEGLFLVFPYELLRPSNPQ